MPEFAWVDLEYAIARALWADFVAEFGFCRDVPAITAPVPSLTWTLPEYESRRPFAQLVNDVLRACLED